MKLLAIDGNSIMNRAFYGIKLLSNSKGQFTNALTGFMNIYLKEIGEVKPDCVAVAFDLKAPTFRHKANAAYKANRKGMPEELAQQMPVIKELLGDLGIKIVQCEGYEADDILGTLSKAAANTDENAADTNETATQTIGYYSLNIQFKSSLSGFKNFADNLTTNNEKSMVIENVNIENVNESEISGTMTLNMYVLKKLADPSAS